MYKVWISGRRLVLEKYTWGITAFRRTGLGESWEGGDIAGAEPWRSNWQRRGSTGKGDCAGVLAP